MATNMSVEKLSGEKLSRRRTTMISTLKSDIAEMERTILSNKNSISNFSSRGSGDAVYNASRIENATKKIEELSTQILTLEQKIHNVKEGFCDGEIQIDFEKDKEFLMQQTEKSKIFLESESVAKEAGKVRSKAFYQIERNSAYNDRAVEKELSKYWDAIASLPPNIVKNIETTPSNRCYRHRGVCFYGKRPEQKPDMVFQKTHGGTLITEITDTMITTFLKPFNGGNKTLVSKFSRELSDGLCNPAKKTLV